jgi:nucleoid-associated protein YgaU
MTSPFRTGIIGLGVVGLALGAYLVNRGHKDGSPAKTGSETTKLATADQPGDKPAADNAQPVVPPAPPAPAVTHADHAASSASPAAPTLVGNHDDSARTWRPRMSETSEAQPSLPPVPNPVLSDPTKTSEPAHLPTPAAGGTETRSTPPPAPVTPGLARMSLEEQGATTRPAAASPAAKAAETPKMTVHTVQRGDTFSSLAAKYLGSAKKANLIEKANPRINPNRLYVGAKLNIPAAPPATPATTENKAAGSDSNTKAAQKASGDSGTTQVKATEKSKPAFAPPPVDPKRAYTVKANDNWSSLGRRFMGDATAWTVIYEYNRERFSNGWRSLHAGMVIEIPDKDAAPSGKSKETASAGKNAGPGLSATTR